MASLRPDKKTTEYIYLTQIRKQQNIFTQLRLENNNT